MTGLSLGVVMATTDGAVTVMRDDGLVYLRRSVGVAAPGDRLRFYNHGACVAVVRDATAGAVA